MIVRELPNFLLEAETVQCGRLVALNLYQTWPQALHPTKRRIAQFNLDRAELRAFGEYLIKEATL